MHTSPPPTQDVNMALFRVSKAMRDVSTSDPLRVNLQDDARWHTVRYEKERAVICRCRSAAHAFCPQPKKNERGRGADRKGLLTKSPLFGAFSSQGLCKKPVGKLNLRSISPERGHLKE